MSCSTAEKEFPRRHYMVEGKNRDSNPHLLTSLSCRRRYHGAIVADL
jgi:hypothetical protein